MIRPADAANRARWRGGRATPSKCVCVCVCVCVVWRAFEVGEMKQTRPPSGPHPTYYWFSPRILRVVDLSLSLSVCVFCVCVFVYYLARCGCVPT
jgi:hypothetical protein